MNHILEYTQQLHEVNRIIQGLANRSGKPVEHVGAIWKETDKEVLVKHTHGVTDRYKQIGDIVRKKLGVKPDPEDEPKEKKVEND